MTVLETLAPRDVFAAARASGRTSLLESEVYALLSGAGFDVPRHVAWEGAPDARLPGPVRSFLDSLGGAGCVLKIVSPDLLHKTEVGGVAFVPAEEGVLPRPRRRSGSPWGGALPAPPGSGFSSSSGSRRSRARPRPRRSSR